MQPQAKYALTKVRSAQNVLGRQHPASDPHRRQRACVNAADTRALHAHRIDWKTDMYQLDYQPILQLLQGLCPFVARDQRADQALQFIGVNFRVPWAAFTPSVHSNCNFVFYGLRLLFSLSLLAEPLIY